MRGNRNSNEFALVKGVVIAVFAIFLSSCDSHYKIVGHYTLQRLEGDCIELLKLYKPSQPIEITKYPKSIEELDPLGVFVDKTGLYIKLDDSWFEESGLYAPREGFIVDPSKFYASSYVKIGDHLYSYIKRG